MGGIRSTWPWHPYLCREDLPPEHEMFLGVSLRATCPISTNFFQSLYCYSPMFSETLDEKLNSAQGVAKTMKTNAAYLNPKPTRNTIFYIA